MGKILKHPFTVMTFKEASDLLASKGNSIVPPNHGLSREQELLLVEKLNDGVPVFVINWPSNIKPFYMRQIEEDPSLVSNIFAGIHSWSRVSFLRNIYFSAQQWTFLCQV